MHKFRLKLTGGTSEIIEAKRHDLTTNGEWIVFLNEANQIVTRIDAKQVFRIDLEP